MNTTKHHISDENKKSANQQYHQEYWKQYRKKRKRITGTMSHEEYKQIDERAQQYGQSVWEHIFKVYSQADTGEASPMLTQTSKERIQEVIYKLSNIGCTINQITRELQEEGKDTKQCDDFVEELQEDMRYFREMLDNDL